MTSEKMFKILEIEGLAIHMNRKPNLFSFAPSELSQDAILCWLISWSDQNLAEVDGPLYRSGCRFVNALLALHDVSEISISSVKVLRQFRHVDIVALINDRIALVIEDKTDSREHSDQLERYTEVIAGEYSDRTILPIYLKTGDQGDYSVALSAGYKIMRRRDLLKLLIEGRDDGVTNAIYLEFLAYLEARQAAAEAYKTTLPPWTGNTWQGLYEALSGTLPDLGFGYVPTASGGFFGAWWHWRKWGDCDVYLQIEEQYLCFKIGMAGVIRQNAERGDLRDAWAARIREAATSTELEVIPPGRRGNGETMTCMRVASNQWLIPSEAGGVDLVAVTVKLQEAGTILDLATADSL